MASKQSGCEVRIPRNRSAAGGVAKLAATAGLAAEGTYENPRAR